MNSDTYEALYDNYKQADFQLKTTTLKDSSASKKMTYLAIGRLHHDHDAIGQ